MPDKVSIEVRKQHESKDMSPSREVTEDTKTGHADCLSSGPEANYYLAEGV
jgi:hypothetical protein